MLQAIYTAQKGYACSGDEELEKTLIDLLVDRSGQKDRDLKTLALNDAIAVLPKLTVRQRQTIAVCFFISHTRYYGPFDLNSYFTYLDVNLTPLATLASNKRADYQHIQSSGAGAINALHSRLRNDILFGFIWLLHKWFHRRQDSNEPARA